MDTPVQSSKLAEALAKAQGAIQSAEKSQENPFYSKANKKATYADISDVIEVIKKPAADNGLSVTFDFKSEGTNTFIQYKLRHVSGESEVSQWLLMFLKESTAHAFGAANTYYRRQLLKAIYQIPEEDDDGNSLSGKCAPDDADKAKAAVAQAEKKRLADEALKAKAAAKQPPAAPVSLLEQLVTFAREHDIPNDEMATTITRVVGRAAKSTDLTPQEITEILKYLTMKFKR